MEQIELCLACVNAIEENFNRKYKRKKQYGNSVNGSKILRQTIQKVQFKKISVKTKKNDLAFP